VGKCIHVYDIGGKYSLFDFGSKEEVDKAVDDILDLMGWDDEKTGGYLDLNE